MKRIVLIALMTSSFAHAAGTPDNTSLLGALAIAQSSWGLTLGPDADIVFRLEPINACPLREDHEIATTQFLDFVTTTRFDGDLPPIISHHYTYVIRLNSACDWSSLNLVATVTHEYGHILLGAAYHSLNKHSIMFRNVQGDQVITAADLKALADRDGIAKIK